MINAAENQPFQYYPDKEQLCATPNAGKLKQSSEKNPLARQVVAVRNAKTVAEWKNLQATIPGACLVHSLHDIHLGFGTDLFDHPAQSVLSQWDLISTSLVNLCDIKKFSQSASAEYLDHIKRKNGCYGEIGLILDVPPQNIYGTHSEDVHVDNHAGVDRSIKKDKDKARKDGYTLADHLKRGINNGGDKVTDGFSRFVSPTQLLKETKDYNEVLVIGRDAVNINFGERQTRPIKVVGILSARTKKFLHPTTEQISQSMHEEAILKLQAMNPDLKVFRF